MNIDLREHPKYIDSSCRNRVLRFWGIECNSFNDPVRERIGEPTFFYVAHTKSWNKIKIGTSTNPLRRIHRLHENRRGNVIIQLAWFCEGGLELENTVRMQFNKHRCNAPHSSLGNDWFFGVDELLDFAREQR